MSIISIEDSIFYKYEPRKWVVNSQEVYSVPRTHGFSVRYVLHNPYDEINDNRSELDKVLVEYQIDGSSYDLFTMNDLFSSDYAFDNKSGGGIVGDIGERIARLIAQHFIEERCMPTGKGDIPDKNASRDKDYVIANNEEYVLKSIKYPNLVLLRKVGEGKYGYKNITELDALFDYRFFMKRELIVMESKAGKIDLKPDAIVNDLFMPLRSLFPDAILSYMLFANFNSLYNNENYEKRRQLQELPARIYTTLRAKGINSLFLCFAESRDQFDRIKDHLITQYWARTMNGFCVDGRTLISSNEIVVYDKGQVPHLKLVKDKRTKLWREVPVKHKSRRNKQKKHRRK